MLVSAVLALNVVTTDRRLGSFYAPNVVTTDRRSGSFYAPNVVTAVVVSSVGLGEPRSAGKNQLDVNLGLSSVSSGGVKCWVG